MEDKYIFLIILLILVIVLFLYRHKTRENFESAKPVIDYRGVGTYLRDIPSVNRQMMMFRSVQPQTYKDTEGYMLQMPKNFDGRTVWKDYLRPITNQGVCGNCWAHAGSNSLADRFAIMSLGQIDFIPSPYEITVCGVYQWAKTISFNNTNEKIEGGKYSGKNYSEFVDTLKNNGIPYTESSSIDGKIDIVYASIDEQWGNENELKAIDDIYQGRVGEGGGCGGASVVDSANILYADGITDIGCFPPQSDNKKYNIPNTDPGSSKEFPYCYQLQSLYLDTCVDGVTPMRKYKAKTVYTVGNVTIGNTNLASEIEEIYSDSSRINSIIEDIRQEIYRNGSLFAGFMVYKDLQEEYEPKSQYNVTCDSISHTGNTLVISCDFKFNKFMVGGGIVYDGTTVYITKFVDDNTVETDAPITVGDSKNITVLTPNRGIFRYNPQHHYTGNNDYFLGGHAIRVVGWGEDECTRLENDKIVKETVSYWIIANSWGEEWGEKGYFKLESGNVGFQLEMNCMGMLPDFNGMEIINPRLKTIESDFEKYTVEFTGRKVDNKSGFYTTAINDCKRELNSGDTSPYMKDDPVLPDYYNFYAAEIGDYTIDVENCELPNLACNNKGKKSSKKCVRSISRGNSSSVSSSTRSSTSSSSFCTIL
jgi:hypothetical protein